MNTIPLDFAVVHDTPDEYCEIFRDASPLSNNNHQYH